MSRAFVAVWLGLSLLALAAAQTKTNPCDIHHWDELSGAPQNDPDRPCRVQYTKENAIRKRRLILQRQQLFAQQQTIPAATSGPTPDQPAAEPASGVVHTQAISTKKLLALHGSGAGADMLATTTIQAIFWGPSWGVSSFVGDKITGMSQFYAAHNNSRYAATCSEYSGHNGKPGFTTFAGAIIDLSSTSGVNPDSTTQIGARVCAAATKMVPDGFYPVFVDLPRGSRGYCAWHWYGSCYNGVYSDADTGGGSGIRMTFAFHFDLTVDAGCNPGDYTTGHSPVRMLRALLLLPMSRPMSWRSPGRTPIAAATGIPMGTRMETSAPGSLTASSPFLTAVGGSCRGNGVTLPTRVQQALGRTRAAWMALEDALGLQLLSRHP